MKWMWKVELNTNWTWKSDEKWEKHRSEITQKTPNSDETNEWMKWMN